MSDTPRWRIVIGCDEAGWEYKELIRRDLEADERVGEVVDLGVKEGEPTPYSEIGIEAGQRIAAGAADRAVLICGTGIGMAISANKVPGIRATTAHDSFSAERSVLSNNCQVLTMGQRVIGSELARRLAHEWVGYVFDPSSPSQAKVAVIDRYEQAARTAGPGSASSQ
ncbi:MAG TPA: RpiB/LacA/LacB family sugar-phosphate isomerase [Acidimicrobiales bacterium]|jgi:ribose 5-phosphate isomerase B